MYLTAEEIEQVATRVVSAYRKLPALSGKVISCIDPLILATELLHLKVEYHKLSPEGTILGLTVLSAALIGVYDNGETEFREMDGRTVFIERDLLQANVGRHNFTLTHEASHQVLKMLYPSAYAAAKKMRRVFCSARSRVGGGWEEWQANQLTAAILMPRDLLLDYMRTLGLGSKIRCLNRVFHPKEYQKFEAIADGLGVSKAALVIRLRQLDLIEHDYYGRPYDLVNIWADEQEEVS